MLTYRVIGNKVEFYMDGVFVAIEDLPELRKSYWRATGCDDLWCALNDYAPKLIEEVNKYPVSQECCQGCDSCYLITSTFNNVSNLDPKDYYWGCRANMENECDEQWNSET